MRSALENLFAFLLRHAAQHAKLLALGHELLIVRQSMEDFLLRLIPDGASVVQNQVSLLHRLHLPVPLMHQCANDLFRVMHIHLAAKGFEVKRLLGICRHIPSQYKRCPRRTHTLIRRAPSSPTNTWILRIDLHRSVAARSPRDLHLGPGTISDCSAEFEGRLRGRLTYPWRLVRAQ